MLFLFRLIVLMLLCSLASKTFAQHQGDNLAALGKILALPNDKMDLVKAKLLINHMIDPRVDMVSAGS